jgi:site-specific recombinase XerD
MLRLGLRAGDIAALQLDDLDWRAGEIVVCGKGRRQTRLPLPQDVGREIAAYLRHRRPEAVTRKVFLRGRAPYGALTPGGVVEAIRAALRRAGITQGGAHVLRHTAATEMLRHGASLPEIAHVLRHRHVDTTAILLLSFAEKRLGKPPSALSLGDVDATFVSGFLDHLERDRSNEARTRNARLAAIRSFFRFAALREPAHGALIQRVLALPQKRFDRDLVTFLTRAEIDAVLAAADRATWLGRRDHVLLAVAVQTGLRVSELTGLRAQDLVLGPAAHVRCHGKGRKERCTPLARPTVALVRTWLAETQATGADLLFATRRGTMLSRDAVDRLVAKYVAAATRMCPSLGRKHVTPHVLRHSTAIGLLEAGVDRAVIALWLGHESVETTQVYLDADLAMKERALARTAPLNVGARRFRPRDSLLSFLEGL